MPVNGQSIATPGLVSLDRVRRRLRYADHETDDDTKLQEIIAGVSEVFRGDCGQPIAVETVIYPVPDWARGCEHLPPYRPIRSFSKLERYDGRGVWTEISTDDFRKVGDGTETIEYDAGFGSERLRATFSVGYSSIPDDVAETVLEGVALVAVEYGVGKLGKARLGQSSEASSGEPGTQATTINYSTARHTPRWNGAVAKYQRLP